jgi:FecR protein/Putative zinc-finger
MKQHELDQAIEEIRSEAADDAVVRASAKRVFSGLFDSPLRSYQVDRIRGCADFRQLMTPYLAHALSPARTLLLEDHTRQCVACRKSLEQARSGAPADEDSRIDFQATSGKRSPALVWALAASLAVGIGLGVVGAQNGLLPGQHAVRATVSAVDGSLYNITEFGTRLVAVGDVIRNADQLRTAKGSRAILRLIDGAHVELAERSDVSISRGWKGTTVNVEQGRVIVAAAERNQGSVYVSSGDLLIPVKETVLAVDNGMKGSRVAVAKGMARVQQGSKMTDVPAGQQWATDKYRMGFVPVAAQFSWSQNASTYAALLNEFSTLQQQLQGIPSPDLRYSSNLAKYLPANTVIYAAIPNLAGTLTEAKRIFDERLSQSGVLQEWWSQQSGSHAADMDRAVTQLTSISQYLGNEIVLAVPSTGPHQYGKPIFLAELSQPGLAEYLQQNVPASAGLRIINSASGIPAGANGQLFVDLENNVVAASPDIAALQGVETAISTGSASVFVQTPIFSRISKSYAAGAGYLMAADMEQINPKSVTTATGPLAGLNNVQYLVLERRGVAGGTETRASLSFAGNRQGIASWLGSPGPIGSASFVSPDASFAAAFVMKSPSAVASELVTFASQGNPEFLAQLNGFQSQTGVSLIDDIAAPLGGDATFAMDGPLLPVPTWKLVIEVNDPDRLQKTLNTLVSRYNQTPPLSTGQLQLGSDQVGSRTFYSVRMANMPGLAAYYTFVDGYLVASNGEAALSQAIQNRQAGYTLVSSPNFRNQLPADNFTNFSAILYNNLASTLSPIANQLKDSTSLSASQRQAMAALAASTVPGLICVYGEPDRIVAATRGSFVGFNLGTLAGIEQGKPLMPLIASSVQAARTNAADGPPQSRN